MDLDSKLEMDVNLLQQQIARYNNSILENGWSRELHEEVKCTIKDFNFDRKYEIIHAFELNTPSDLLDAYVKKHTGIRAELKWHGCSSTYSVTYTDFILRFTDMCKYGLKEFDYSALEHFFDSVLYCIFENMKFAEKGSNLPYHSLTNNKCNPYHYYSTRKLIGEEISEIELNSNSAIKKVLSICLSRVFETDFLLTYTRLVRALFPLVATGKGVQKVVNHYFLAYANIKNKVMFCTDNCMPQKSISRHIAWCYYEVTRRCTLLNQPCNSSVNCPFYIESR